MSTIKEKQAENEQDKTDVEEANAKGQSSVTEVINNIDGTHQLPEAATN